MMKSRPIQFLFGSEARDYFDRLEKSSATGDFKIKLQQYWLCCQIGIKFDKKGKVPESKGAWLVERLHRLWPNTQTSSAPSHSGDMPMRSASIPKTVRTWCLS